MSHVQVFRFSVIGSLVCYLIWFFLPDINTKFYSGATLALLDDNGYLALLPMPPAVAFVFLFVWVALARGIWLFSARARLCYLGMTVLTTLLTPFEGFRVQSPIEALCLDVALMLDGAVLALAYFSPVKDEFTTTPSA